MREIGKYAFVRFVMFSIKRSPTPITWHLHPAPINRWLEKRQDLASHSTLIVPDNYWFAIHEANSGECLAKIDWSAMRIAVIDYANIHSPFEFKAFSSALCFLDALLLRHFLRTSEPA